MAHLELETTAMAAGGAAIARDADGRVVFVEGALPGERVRVRVVDRKRDYLRAVAVEVVQASALRVAPPCAALAAGCGGCTWQHVDPAAQGRLKAGVVADALRRIARIDAPEIAVTTSAERPLRTTARLGVDEAGRAGHRRRGSREVIPAGDCLAVDPRLEELIVAGRYPGATQVTIRVAVASGDRMVLAEPHDARVDVPADVAVASGPGDGAVRERVSRRWFRVSAGSFFQPGPAAAEALVATVGAALGDAADGGHLLDLYAGVGLFASVIGARAGSVTAVEQSEVAVADARQNLADLAARVVRSEVGRWRPAPGTQLIDAAVADPARPGLSRPGVATVVAARPARLVLVGCDPASFARDAGLLAAEGYRLASVTVVDAFPDTFHVEAVGRFDLS